jgi:hypothetical protein
MTRPSAVQVEPTAGAPVPPHDDGAAGEHGTAHGNATDDGAPAGAGPAELLMLGGEAPGCVGDACDLPSTGGW